MIKGKKIEGDSKIASIVLAGGQGTRLFPLTVSRCKPAVAFGGRYRLIDIPLSNSLNSHIFRIFVLAQYFATDLYQHIIGTFPTELFQRGDIQLICPEETQEHPAKTNWFKGTADAVRKNLHHFLATPAEYFLILSGDQLYNTHFSEMLKFAVETQADLVIASLPVLEPEAKRMGLLKLDHKGAIEEFFEKPTDPAILKRFELTPDFWKAKGLGKREEPYYLGSMGIYVFKREALVSILKEEGDDFGRHIIPEQVKRGKTFGYVFNGYWEDIGTVSSYYQANLALLTQKNCLDTYDENYPIYTHPHQLPSPIIRNTTIQHSLISQGAIIDAKEITNSIIGVRSQIKPGTIIRNSILMGNKFYTPPSLYEPPLPKQLCIGKNCLIEKAIIDEHVCIGNNVMLTNQKGIQTYDGPGIYIRDGITIVTSGTTLPDNFVL